MSVGDFESFLAAIGHRVVRTERATWYDAGRYFFLSLPSHRAITPEREELRTVFRSWPCAGVRFPAPLEGLGRLSYQIVCDDSSYSLETLSANVRSKVRRGLRRCAVRPVSFLEILDKGRRADADTRARQGRGNGLSVLEWERYWRAAAATPSMSAWGAFSGEDLAAYLVSVDLGECVEFLVARSRSDCLDCYPNNALLFVATQETLRRGVGQITFGLEALEVADSVDEFKFSMGYRRRPIRQRVVFHPVIEYCLRVPGFRTFLLRWAAARGKKQVFWRKALGLLRFAEQSAGVGLPTAEAVRL